MPDLKEKKQTSMESSVLVGNFPAIPLYTLDQVRKKCGLKFFERVCAFGDSQGPRERLITKTI